MLPPRLGPSAGHQRRQRLGQRLERVRAGLEGGAGAVARRRQEVAAERVGGREGDRVDDAVDPAPAAAELARAAPRGRASSLTSSSSTSGGRASRFAARSVIRRMRPKLVSTHLGALLAGPRSAIAKAIECGG